MHNPQPLQMLVFEPVELEGPGGITLLSVSPNSGFCCNVAIAVVIEMAISKCSSDLQNGFHQIQLEGTAYMI